MTHDDLQDLPALRTPLDPYLPALLPPNERHQQRIVEPLYQGWSTFANQRHIHALANDPLTGNLWLATSGGVQCWTPDGQTFTRYGSEHGLITQSITAIAVDKQSQVWLAYEGGGIGYIHEHIWYSYEYLEQVVGCCFCRDVEENLWVATVRGVYKLGAVERPPLLTLPFLGEPPHALAITQSSMHQRQVWLGTARGLLRYDIDDQDTVERKNDWVVQTAQIGILVLAGSGNQLWIGTTNGLAFMDVTNNKIVRSEVWPTGVITALTPLGEGVWVACGNEVGQAIGESWTSFGGEKIGQLGTRITGIVAQDDLLWLGTHSGLLHVTRTDAYFYLTNTPPDCITYTSLDPLRTLPGGSNMIQALAIQQYQQETILWMGTTTGLVRVNTATNDWQRNSQRGLYDIRAIAMGSTYNIVLVASWVAGIYDITVHKGIQSLKPDKSGPLVTVAFGYDEVAWAAGIEGLYRRRSSEVSWIQVITSERLPRSGWIRTILQVSPTQVWLGTSNGLLRYNPITDMLQPVNGILGNTEIYTLLAIPQQQKIHLWIGTHDGLFENISTDLSLFKVMQDMTGHTITALAYDEETSVIWIGTTRGLYRMQQVRFKNNKQWSITNEWTSRTSGLVADHITALALNTEQQHKQLWIGTSCGCSCLTY